MIYFCKQKYYLQSLIGASVPPKMNMWRQERGIFILFKECYLIRMGTDGHNSIHDPVCVSVCLCGTNFWPWPWIGFKART